MSTKSLLVLILIFGGSLVSFSQTQKIEPLYPTHSIEPSGIAPLKSDYEIMKELYNELEGTFEIESSQSDYSIIYTRELMELIKASGLVGQTVTLDYDAYTTIIIAPLPSNGSSSLNENH